MSYRPFKKTVILIGGSSEYG